MGGITSKEAGLTMGFLERLLTFGKGSDRKKRGVQQGRTASWPYLFAFAAPVLTAFIFAAWGRSYMGGLGSMDHTILGLSSEESVVLLRKYTLFIPLTGLPFFFWIFKQSDKSDWAGKVKLYLFYSFLIWASCYALFLLSMFMPRF
jgi:hypothetical protein